MNFSLIILKPLKFPVKPDAVKAWLEQLPLIVDYSNELILTEFFERYNFWNRNTFPLLSCVWLPLPDS